MALSEEDRELIRLLESQGQGDKAIRLLTRRSKYDRKNTRQSQRSDFWEGQQNKIDTRSARLRGVVDSRRPKRNKLDFTRSNKRRLRSETSAVEQLTNAGYSVAGPGFVRGNRGQKVRVQKTRGSATPEIIVDAAPRRVRSTPASRNLARERSVGTALDPASANAMRTDMLKQGYKPWQIQAAIDAATTLDPQARIAAGVKAKKYETRAENRAKPRKVGFTSGPSDRPFTGGAPATRQIGGLQGDLRSGPTGPFPEELGNEVEIDSNIAIIDEQLQRILNVSSQGVSPTPELREQYRELTEQREKLLRIKGTSPQKKTEGPEYEAPLEAGPGRAVERIEVARRNPEPASAAPQIQQAATQPANRGTAGINEDAQEPMLFRDRYEQGMAIATNPGSTPQQREQAAKWLMSLVGHEQYGDGAAKGLEMLAKANAADVNFNRQTNAADKLHDRRLDIMENVRAWEETQPAAQQDRIELALSKGSLPSLPAVESLGASFEGATELDIAISIGYIFADMGKFAGGIKKELKGIKMLPGAFFNTAEGRNFIENLTQNLNFLVGRSTARQAINEFMRADNIADGQRKAIERIAKWAENRGPEVERLPGVAQYGFAFGKAVVQSLRMDAFWDAMAGKKVYKTRNKAPRPRVDRGAK